MGDRLIISDLSASCCVGVTKDERCRRQPVWIDLELGIDVRQAASTDDVEKTVDYAQLAQAVKQLVEGKPYRLLETMADEVATLVLSRFKTSRVGVRIKKRALPDIGFAAVEISRPI